MTKTVTIFQWLLNLPDKISKLLNNHMKILGILMTVAGSVFLYGSLISFDFTENFVSVVLIILGLYLWDISSIEE